MAQKTKTSKPSNTIANKARRAARNKAGRANAAKNPGSRNAQKRRRYFASLKARGYQKIDPPAQKQVNKNKVNNRVIPAFENASESRHEVAEVTSVETHAADNIASESDNKVKVAKPRKPRAKKVEVDDEFHAPAPKKARKAKAEGKEEKAVKKASKPRAKKEKVAV